jgi:hypothetical protein
MRLVVARYNEDLSWLAAVPEFFLITVYDKGPRSGGGGKQQHPYRSRCNHNNVLRIPEAVADRTTVVPLPNVGREADTYLKHIISTYEDGEDDADWTIFTQGDPFDHSPDFLDLLQRQAIDAYMRPVQPLSDRWDTEHHVPPCCILERYHSGRERLLGKKVSAHPFSSHTLDTIRFFDNGSRAMRDDTLRYFNIGPGTNIIEHVLKSCGVDTKRDRIGSVSYLCFGAIVAVHREGLRRHSLDIYRNLEKYNLEHAFIGGYIMERCWLTLFGFRPLGDECV